MTKALGKGLRFAECHALGTRQRHFLFFLKTFFAELRIGGHSAKIFQKKSLKNFAECLLRWHSAMIFQKKNKNLCRVPARLALGKVAVTGFSAVTATFLCQVLTQHSAKPLPSARRMALGKGSFADDFFRVLFAECKRGFAECRGHSAKNAYLVVNVYMCDTCCTYCV
jgi:hypothetical protein